MLETPAIIALAIMCTVLILAALAWHLWYAAGFARVLAAHELPSWRAWVPVINDAELFRLGRVDPVKVALFFVPIVSIYALVLKVVAAHRVGAQYGRGAGTTVLAILLPPVWSGVLGADKRSAVDEEADDDEPIALMPALTAVELAPAPPPPAPVTAGPGPVTAPPGPGAISPSVFAPSPAPATPIAAPPATAAPAPATPAPVPAPVTPSPAPQVDVPGPRRSRRTEAAPPVPVPPEERTQLSRGPRAWEIELPSGQVVPAVARTIVLGRKPAGVDDAVQYVTVVDDTRTVSKEHARLIWSGDGWTLTDLGSTNGVALVAADGSEQRLAASGSAPAAGGFLLGDARLVIRLATR